MIKTQFRRDIPEVGFGYKIVIKYDGEYYPLFYLTTEKYSTKKLVKKLFEFQGFSVFLDKPTNEDIQKFAAELTIPTQIDDAVLKYHLQWDADKVEMVAVKVKYSGVETQGHYPTSAIGGTGQDMIYANKLRVIEELSEIDKLGFDFEIKYKEIML